jgi:hypothetical protein
MALGVVRRSAAASLTVRNGWGPHPGPDPSPRRSGAKPDGPARPSSRASGPARDRLSTTDRSSVVGRSWLPSVPPLEPSARPSQQNDLCAFSSPDITRRTYVFFTTLRHHARRSQMSAFPHLFPTHRQRTLTASLLSTSSRFARLGLAALPAFSSQVTTIRSQHPVVGGAGIGAALPTELAVRSPAGGAAEASSHAELSRVTLSTALPSRLPSPLSAPGDKGPGLSRIGFASSASR